MGRHVNVEEIRAAAVAEIEIETGNFSGKIQVCPRCGLWRVVPDNNDWWSNYGGECYQCWAEADD